MIALQGYIRLQSNHQLTVKRYIILRLNAQVGSAPSQIDQPETPSYIYVHSFACDQYLKAFYFPALSEKIIHN